MISDNIRRICKEQDRSVYGVEKAAGISKGYIYNMKNPSLHTLQAIAKELKVDVCDLIAEDNNRT